MAIKKAVKEKKAKPKLAMPEFVAPTITVAAVLSLCIAGWMMLARAPSFWPVKQIATIGKLEHVTQQQLIDILAIENSTGMLTVDLQNIRQKTLQLPWVKSVDVRKDWPDTLTFFLEEYQPIALINKHYLTEQGSLIEKGSYVYNQPILTLAIENKKIIREIDLVALVENIGDLQERLNGHQLKIERMTISESNSWLISIENKFVIKAGRRHQMKRIENFLDVYAEIQNKNKLESIDLRYSNGLAVKLFEEPATPVQNG